MTEINAPATDDGFAGVDDPERTYCGVPLLESHTARRPDPDADHATPAPVPLTPGSKATPAWPFVDELLVPEAVRFQSRVLPAVVNDCMLLVELDPLFHAAASTLFLIARPPYPRLPGVGIEPKTDEYVGVTNPVAVGFVTSMIDAVPVPLKYPAT